MARKKTKIKEEDVVKKSSSSKTEEVTQDSEPVTPKTEVKVLSGNARATKKKLDSEDKVSRFVPLGAGEKPGVTQQVNINGVNYFIRKGVSVDVPVSVAALLDEKLKASQSAANHPNNVTGAKDVKLTAYGG